MEAIYDTLIEMLNVRTSVLHLASMYVLHLDKHNVTYILVYSEYMILCRTSRSLEGPSRH